MKYANALSFDQALVASQRCKHYPGAVPPNTTPIGLCCGGSIMPRREGPWVLTLGPLPAAPRYRFGVRVAKRVW